MKYFQIWRFLLTEVNVSTTIYVFCGQLAYNMTSSTRNWAHLQKEKGYTMDLRGSSLSSFLASSGLWNSL